MAINTTRRGFTQMIVRLAAVIGLAFSLLISFIPASAHENFAMPLSQRDAGTVCGDGSAPDYGFTYNRQQPHWTVGWQGYASQQTVDEVDVVLDRLNAGSIAQTMILILPQDQVGNRVNCAVHFLRYMKLGLPTGERKDNGFVFLIVVEPDRIDVHYGVGLGLPALTASELTNLNRVGESAYQSNHSMDDALLTLVQQFDALARSEYEPLVFIAPTSDAIDLPPLPSGPLGMFTVCGMMCLGFLLFMFLMWFLSQLGRMGGGFSSRRSWGGGVSRGWGRGGSSWGGGFPRIGGRGGGPSMRGGSGSGRSGRGN